MGIIGSGLILLGWVVGLVGWIMVLIAAFKKGIWWGLGSLFIWPVMLVFIILNWAIAKKGFLLQVAAFVLFIVGFVVAAMGGGASAAH